MVGRVQPIGSIELSGSLPVWVDYHQSENPKTYDGLIWEKEPLGEYLYYLAGDFDLTEDGLLRYNSAMTMLSVEASHERDFIGVTEHDGQIAQSIARNSQISVDHLNSLSLDAVAQPFSRSVQRFNDVCGYVTMNMGENLTIGMGRLEIEKPVDSDRFRVTLFFQKILCSPGPTEPDLALTIMARSVDPDVEFAAMRSHFERMVEVYSVMPYRRLFGATRL
jgi:hypothetical protein